MIAGKEVILCKYGEIALKGDNRSFFDGLLLRELKTRAKRYGNFSVASAQSTAYIEPLDDACDIDGLYESVKHVFGVVSVGRALAAEKDMDSILAAVRSYSPPRIAGVKRFRADAKRSDKRFPLKSPEIAAEVGGALLECIPGIKVDLHDPEVSVTVEVRESCAYIRAGQEKGAGGMPLRSNGKALLLLSGGIDSPVAGYMIAKRGVALEALHFDSAPYTSERALEKVLSLADLLCEYTGHLRVNAISLTHIQEELRAKCEESYFTLLLRKFMMALAERCANARGLSALITGESLGQVASQTMEALGVTNHGISLPIFRPCIGMDKEEIITVARKIDTFDTSVLPYEDCCTVFTPRHPRTKPVLEKVEAELAKVDFEALCDEAFEGMRYYYRSI